MTRTILSVTFSLSLLVTPAIAEEPWYTLSNKGCTPLVTDQWSDKPTTPDKFFAEAKSLGGEVKIIQQDEGSVFAKMRFPDSPKITGLMFYRGEDSCKIGQRMLKN